MHARELNRIYVRCSADDTQYLKFNHGSRTMTPKRFTLNVRPSLECEARAPSWARTLWSARGPSATARAASSGCSAPRTAASDGHTSGPSTRPSDVEARSAACKTGACVHTKSAYAAVAGAAGATVGVVWHASSTSSSRPACTSGSTQGSERDRRPARAHHKHVHTCGSCSISRSIPPDSSSLLRRVPRRQTAAAARPTRGGTSIDSVRAHSPFAAAPRSFLRNPGGSGRAPLLCRSAAHRRPCVRGGETVAVGTLEWQHEDQRSSIARPR